MIVFDENIHQQSLMDQVSKFYKGRVASITELRIGTIIKDDSIPTVLKNANQPTFVTTNVSDFWTQIQAHSSYCVVCMLLPNERVNEIPLLLKRLLRLPEFKSKANRMGKVIRVRQESIDYYQIHDTTVYSFSWQPL